MLKSPWVDVSALLNPSISFSVFSKNNIDEFYNTLKVTLYDSNGTSFTDVITVNDDTKIWRDFVIDLSDYSFSSSEIQIEFKVLLNSSFSRRYNDILIDEVNFGELPSCRTPINPMITNVSGRTAEFSWESTNDETNWEIQYGFSGFTIAGATTIFTSNNPYTLISLVPERLYDVYVRAICDVGDSSEFIGPVTFATTELCPSPTNFRTNSVTKNSAQLSWDDVDGGADWEVEYGEGYFTPGNGTVETVSTNLINLENLIPDTTYYTYLRRNCGDEDGNSDNYLISFRTEQACTVPFNFRTTNITKNSASFEWSNNGDANEWEIEYNDRFFIPGNGQGITQVISTNTFNLENLLPDTFYYIYLRSNCGLEDGYSRWTQYIGFRTSIACNAPNNFSVSNVTKNTVILNWFNGTNVSEWEVEYNDRFFTPGTGEGLREVVTSNSVTLQNLTPDTTYYAYVRSNCGIDGYSTWTGYTYFTTLKACSIPTNFSVLSSTDNSASLVWNDDNSVTSWDVEYSDSPFFPGNGIRITVNDPEVYIENLEPSTLYYAYLRADCDTDGYSNWTNQLMFSTLCELDTEEDNLIVNGGFECASIAGWDIGGPDVFNGCTYNFAALASSNSVCVIVNDIFPTEGNYAAFTSFDGSAGTVYSLSQNIEIPANISMASSAVMSYDFKVNYQVTFNNPTQERVFEVRLTDVNGIGLFKVDELKFGLNPTTGEIERNFSADILSELSAYAGQTVVLNFIAYVPEESTGPAKAMLDNVSVIVDGILSNSNKSLENKDLMVYPIPNKGSFTINNLNDGLIEMVEIFDVSGRIIEKEKMKTPLRKVDINMQNVTSGVYFIKILIEGSKYIKRIVVE